MTIKKETRIMGAYIDYMGNISVQTREVEYDDTIIPQKAKIAVYDGEILISKSEPELDDIRMVSPRKNNFAVDKGTPTPANVQAFLDNSKG